MCGRGESSSTVCEQTHVSRWDQQGRPAAYICKHMPWHSVHTLSTPGWRWLLRLCEQLAHQVLELTQQAAITGVNVLPAHTEVQMYISVGGTRPTTVMPLSESFPQMFHTISTPEVHPAARTAQCPVDPIPSSLHHPPHYSHTYLKCTQALTASCRDGPIPSGPHTFVSSSEARAGASSIWMLPSRVSNRPGGGGGGG